MSLDDFFGDEEKRKKEKKPKKKVSKPIKKIEEKDKVQQTSELPKIDLPSLSNNQDIENVFLLDVMYERDLNLAQCIFYHEESRSIYKWNDVSGHKPYLLTLMSPETINEIDKIVDSKEFVKMEEVEKFLLIEAQHQKLTKVIGTNPLAIGGRPQSFREFVDPAYEADIRYHFNYVADKSLTPGSYYNVINGKLVPNIKKIDPKIKDQLLKEFENEKQEQLEMLDEYMPILFQSIPDLLRCAFDIEIQIIRLSQLFLLV
ncbi:MAG: hypothetical protein ACXAD7_12720 [Candidatus Kariarchaeaceae archaeon]|jgi:DNA polymerase I